MLRRAPARNGRTWTLSGTKKRYGLCSLKTVACSIVSLLCKSMSNPKTDLSSRLLSWKQRSVSLCVEGREKREDPVGTFCMKKWLFKA